MIITWQYQSDAIIPCGWSAFRLLHSHEVADVSQNRLQVRHGDPVTSGLEGDGKLAELIKYSVVISNLVSELCQDEWQILEQ